MLVAAGSSVWAGDGKRLLSAEPLTGQLLLAPQHGCSGGERFTLRLSRTGELEMCAEPARQQLQQQGEAAAAATVGSEDRSGRDSGVDSSAANRQPVPVVAQQQGRLSLHSRGGKPSKFGLELASHRPTLLLTAHGHLVSSCGRSSGRPCGILPAAAQPAAGENYHCSAGGGSGSEAGSSAGPSAAAVQACAWRLEHHGDGVYRLQADSDRRSLYIDDAGVPCLDAPAGPAGTGGSLVFPDPRLLFWIEPAWVELGAEQGASGSGASSSSCDGSAVCDTNSADGSSTFSSSNSSCDRHPHGFALPGSAGLVAAGFTLRSVRCVRGRHLYLSALPDGLLTTALATGPPSRWEVFSVIDLEVRQAIDCSILGGGI